MFPRRTKRTFLLGLVCGNIFLLFWIFAGNNDLKAGSNPDINIGGMNDYADEVAVAMGRKMKIHGAHPQPKRQFNNNQDELIIDEIDNHSDKKTADIDVHIPEHREKRGFVELESQRLIKNQDLNEDYKDEGEDDGDYNDEGDDQTLEDPKHYAFKGMHRSKKTSNDLFERGKVDIKSIRTKLPDKNSTYYVGFNTQYVHHCITRDVIGLIPANIKTEDLTALSIESPEDGGRRKASFHKVFKERSWGKGWDKAYDRLDASGRGAQLSWAQEFIATLQLLISDIKTKLGKSRVKILDVPCGDMAWMSRFLVTRDDVDYVGIDIVPELIENHRKAYRSYPWKFKMVDVIDHPLNESYDIIINRMLLQHLYFGDAVKLLQRFSNSGSTFLVTTSFPRVDQNQELSLEDNPGRIRQLNMELPPLSLTPPLCLTRDGPPDTFEGWDHFAGVWKLPLKRIKNCKVSKAMKLKHIDHTIYSCVKWTMNR